MFAFGGENVTRGNLKNLIVDKPSPITVALAQKSDSDGMFAFGGENVTRGNLKNLIVDKPSPITVALAQIRAPNATQVQTKFNHEMTVDGQKLNFDYIDEEEAKNVKIVKKEQKRSWVTDPEDEEEDEEIRKMRREMKNGVLAYDSYMQKKLHI